MIEWGGLDLDFWRTTPEWPAASVTTVCIIPGGAGHESEITVSFHDDDSMPLYDWDDPQPDSLVGIFQSLLPDGWAVDDRGTRIELHPSGRRYGGFDALDVNAVKRACAELGFEFYIPGWVS